MQLARELPNVNFRLIASSLNTGLDSLPPNVVLERDKSSEYFNEVLAGAELVIVPLKENVGSSGQMLAIAAMRSRRPIVYSDIPAINYYFVEGTAMPYKMGDISSLKEAVAYLLSHPAEAFAMAEQGYQNSLKYTSEACYEMMDKVIFS